MWLCYAFWSERSACAALGLWAETGVATIKGIFAKCYVKSKLKDLLQFQFLQHPPTQSIDISFCQALNQSQTILGIFRQKTTFFSSSRIEDNLNFSKIKDILNFSKMEDDLNFFQNFKKTSIFSKMEDDLIFLEKVRQFKYFSLSTKLQAQPFYISNARFPLWYLFRYLVSNRYLLLKKWYLNGIYLINRYLFLPKWLL